jgi:hypothetical protein
MKNGLFSRRNLSIDERNKGQEQGKDAPAPLHPKERFGRSRKLEKNPLTRNMTIQE